VAEARPAAAELRIQRARRDEVPALAALVELVRVPGWSRDSLAGSLVDPASLALVARAPDPVGFALARGAAQELEVLLVVVAPHARRRGIGRALVAALLAAAGAQRAHLEVRASNRGAIALYERAGFVASGLRKRYYADAEDALTMSWTPEPIP
jgi:ribosomal protein S18 acetylase RimI-like enzyme